MALRRKLNKRPNARTRRVIGRIVSSVVRHKQIEENFLRSLDEVVNVAFKKYGFVHEERHTPQAAVREIVPFLIGHYMRKVGLNPTQQTQLWRLLAMAENREIKVVAGKLRRKAIKKIDAVGLKEDLDKLYELFWRVMAQIENHRAEYTRWLYADMGGPGSHVTEKVHIVQAAPRYITELFDRALDALWAYKALKKKK